jgi:two-component system, sensor histidine kinase and response regulator
MIIDDEEFCVAAMLAMLNMNRIDIKHIVDSCINGKEALKKIKESYDKGLSYSIIFTDFQMPVMDGIEATQKIRQVLTIDYDIKR